MRTTALFGAKNFGIFQNLCYVSTDKGEGVNFSQFCASVFHAQLSGP